MKHRLSAEDKANCTAQEPVAPPPLPPSQPLPPPLPPPPPPPSLPQPPSDQPSATACNEQQALSGKAGAQAHAQLGAAPAASAFDRPIPQQTPHSYAAQEQQSLQRARLVAASDLSGQPSLRACAPEKRPSLVPRPSLLAQLSAPSTLPAPPARQAAPALNTVQIWNGSHGPNSWQPAADHAAASRSSALLQSVPFAQTESLARGPGSFSEGR